MPKFSVKKPLTVFVAVLAIVVLGVVAYLKMTPDLMPNMDFPYVILVTTSCLPGPRSTARSGVATAVVLGVGRAIGEAMAIIMVAGNVANMPGLFQSVRFLTTGIISGMSYAPVGSLYQQALFSIGLVLFLFIMLINVFLNVFIKKRKED